MDVESVGCILIRKASSCSAYVPARLQELIVKSHRSKNPVEGMPLP